MTAPDPRLVEALGELDDYLADNLAPLLVADSIQRLLDYPPELTAGKLRIWAGFQFGAGGGHRPFADLLYHAIKKLQLLEELKLLPAERFRAFLGAVAAGLLDHCPAEERPRFVAMLRRLHDVPGGARTVPVDRLHRAAPAGEAGPPAGAPGAPPLSAEETRDVRRFTLLLERALAAGPGGAGDPALLAQQLLVVAASGAKDAGQLATRLAKLREAGVAPAVDRELVRSLVTSVPDWVVNAPAAAAAPHGGSVEAIRRTVQLAGDGARTGARWKELLTAAAEQFNQGSIGRAVTLVELADRMVRDGEVDAGVADLARARAHEAYEITALLQAAAEERHRPSLRRLMEFYPGWSLRELLDELAFEPDQKRRRLILTLIEIWGGDGRRTVVDRLAATIAEGSRNPNAWWYLRNLVYLLNRLPRDAQGDPRQELELVAPFSALAAHPSLQKESFQLLALLPDELGVPTLIKRLAEAEAALQGSQPPPPPLADMWRMLNGLGGALARSGSAAARAALLDHALAPPPRTGDALARLRELGAFDLTGDRRALTRLLAALRDLEPRKVLGFVVGRNDEALGHVARALASTTAPEARRALAELAARFPDRDFGRPPAGALEVTAAEAAADDVETAGSIVVEAQRAALAGDLEVFGLPGLLQSLQQSAATGTLLLRDTGGQPFAEMSLAAGRLAGCRTGRLTDQAAFYQVFEAPRPGTFEFTRAEPSAAGAKELDLVGMLMEAMRRYDELQRVRAVVPDDLLLRAGKARPTAPSGESDGELVRSIWLRVRGGADARQCEQAAPVDAYRVRTLLAHWLEEGALVVAAAPP